jgi:general secretion pathway protein C
MRLRTPSRAERLVRRLPRFTALTAVELLLLALIAVQAARLVWTLVTPVGPVGDWRPAGTMAAPAGDALASFDPFFRLSAGREDRATGRGSAIIALPDGSQRSFAVGEEIIAGVRLAQVGFDSVTIDRGGVSEQIFLDQSETPQPAAGGAPVAVTSAPTQARPQPVVVAPPPSRIPGTAPGDVVVAVNGQPVSSPEQALAAVRAAGGPVNVIVNRGGRAVTLQVRPNP